jgi:photosystem II oxygen-evolving enhancer protein 2
MLKSFLSVILILVSCFLVSCTTDVGGLKLYQTPQGYEFYYPNGWLPVDVKNRSEGVDVVFRDLIEQTENLSVIISDVPDNKTLQNLGSPTEVGYRFFKRVNDDQSLNREAELLTATSREDSKGKLYYILEYQVKLPNNQDRHDLASIAVSQGKLFTFNISSPESHWQRVKKLFDVVVTSFTVY